MKKEDLLRAQWRYRVDNGITGKYYEFRSRYPPRYQHHWYKPGYLQPSGICLSTHKKYYVMEDPMIWSILFITEDETAFDEASEGAFGGEKGLLRGINCWDVLSEMQHEGGQYYEFDLMPLSCIVHLGEN